MTAVSKFRSISNFPELVEYLGDELDWPIETDDFEEMTFEYSAAELGLDKKTSPKFLEIRRLRPLDKDQPWGIFFIQFDDNKLPVVALRRLLSKLVLKKRSTSNTGNRASWHESDLLLISQTASIGTQSISFAHFAANPEKRDLPILKVLGWDNDDTGLKIDYVIETLQEKLIWPDDPTDSDAWRAQWRDAFTLKNREVIQSSKEMAERLGQLALAIRTRLRELLAIESDEGPIHKLMSVFNEHLISDLDTDSFSDMYAQTIAYGLLSARIINPKANTADAAHTQIPITNPFLRELIDSFLNLGGRRQINGVGLDFDELGVNEVVDLLDNTNMEAVLRDFGDRNQKEDPVMHFFEGFLQKYDSKIRKDRGVFYTPQPVVSFIVRSVDEQLRTEFGLEDGLACTTTWGELAERIADLEIPEGTSPDQAFAQILDPATGTGTFAVEVIDLIYKTMTAKWQSQGNREAKIKELWNEYVPKHLLSRLHGYELMMAPYAIAHMKIGLKLYETGYRFESNERARVYLTNALDKPKDFSGTFTFAIPALANEARAVNQIKRNTCFTVIIGNPPYSLVSSNMLPMHRDLVKRYKFIGKRAIEERGALQLEKILNDDYVKFIAKSEALISKSGAGVVGLITNHAYIDNPTMRGMRHSLLTTFELRYICNLHGSSKKVVDLTDENVFDIQQGVSVGIFLKLPDKKPKGINYSQLRGSRKSKLQTLSNLIVSDMKNDILQPTAPSFLFSYFNTDLWQEYERFSSLTEIFPLRSIGLFTSKDSLVIDQDKNKVLRRVAEFQKSDLSNEDLCKQVGITPKKAWNVSKSRERLRSLDNLSDLILEFNHRPFQTKFIFYDKSLVWSMSNPVNRHLVDGKNLALTVSRQLAAPPWNHVFCSNTIVELCYITNRTKEGNHVFPLYIFEDRSNELFSKTDIKPIPNISPVFLSTMRKYIEHGGTLRAKRNDYDEPEAVFYYCYAILHSASYRNRYENFLTSDFPRIPLPKNTKLTQGLIELGSELKSLHLLKTDNPTKNIISLVGIGDFRLEKIFYSDGTVWIDEKKTRGFTGISKEVWEFRVGAYQVCEKWLKDQAAKKGKNPRDGIVLKQNDKELYQKVIVTISETIRIMAEIDEVIDAHGGWPGGFVINDLSN